MCQQKLRLFLAFPELLQHISYRREHGFSNNLPSTAISRARHYSNRLSACAMTLVTEKNLKKISQAPGATGAMRQKNLNPFLLTVSSARFERNGREFDKVCRSASSNW